MSRGNYLFTSESVSEGHPDKVCDRISDAVVDLYLAADPFARVACETLVTTNHIVLAGEVRGPESVTRDAIEATARRAVREIGYEQEGFHWDLASFENHLHEQSADIAMGVDADSAKDKDEGAGDQGIMFGYACRETDALMPAPIFYAHRILHEMAKARHAGRTPELGPDAKSQVTLVYENGMPVRADSIVVSTQHDEHATTERVEEIVRSLSMRCCPRDGSITRSVSTSIRRGGSSSAARMATPSPAASDHRRYLAAALACWWRRVLLARTRPCGPLGGLCSRYLAKNAPAAGSRTNAPCSYPMPLLQPVHLARTCMDVARSPDMLPENGVARGDGLQPARHPRASRPQPSDLRADRRLRHFGCQPENDGGFPERLDLADLIRARVELATCSTWTARPGFVPPFALRTGKIPASSAQGRHD